MEEHSLRHRRLIVNEDFESAWRLPAAGSARQSAATSSPQTQKCGLIFYVVRHRPLHKLLLAKQMKATSPQK
jgi:hypothetical protein